MLLHFSPAKLAKATLGTLLLSSLVSAAPRKMATPPVSMNVPSWGLGPFVKADAANPVLKPNKESTFADPIRGAAVHWEADHTFNPAAVVRDGKVMVIYRAEDDSGAGIGQHTSRLGLAESADGLHFTRRATPVFYPGPDEQKGNEWPGGCEDPRIEETEDGGYALTYTQWNRDKARLAVATSRDLLTWQKHGPVFAKAYEGRFVNEWSKSGSIVTKRQGDHLIATKINGKYWMYWGEGTIHIATSTNLTDWEPVLDANNNLATAFGTVPGSFDSSLAEPGPPAVLTDAGIVFLFNGRNAENAARDPQVKGGAYSGGQVLLDSQNPARLIARTSHPFIMPERPYEVTGQYAAGTVFIEGLVHFKGQWMLYYGTADSFVAVAVAKG